MKYAGWIIALGLVIVLLIQRACSPILPDPKFITTTVLVYDTQWHQVEIPLPKPISESIRLPELNSGSIDSFSLPDSILIKEHYTVRYYQQEYSDSNITLTLKDSVYTNKLTWQGFDYRLLRPTTVINTTIVEPVEVRNRWYVGIGLTDGVTGGSPSVGPEFLLSRDRYAYRIGYHSNNSIQASIYWRIGK
ncbi:MAG: hypothetical protein WC760_06480 [Bacteroidia bacterium]|jgi:hypothetical protein